MGIFRGELAMFHAEDGDYCRWADAQAAIAARDARIAELEADVAHANQGADERLVDLEAAESELQPALETIAARDAEIDRLHDTLIAIGDFAHDRSAGPAVVDALWEVRSMAYEGISQPAPAPEAAQPADTEAQVQAVVKLVVEAQQDAYHAGMAHDGSISSQSAAFQKALQIESAIRRLIGGK
jgi:hypothetical protein